MGMTNTLIHILRLFELYVTAAAYLNGALAFGTPLLNGLDGECEVCEMDGRWTK